MLWSKYFHLGIEINSIIAYKGRIAKVHGRGVGVIWYYHFIFPSLKLLTHIYHPFIPSFLRQVELAFCHILHIYSFIPFLRQFYTLLRILSAFLYSYIIYCFLSIFFRNSFPTSFSFFYHHSLPPFLPSSLPPSYPPSLFSFFPILPPSLSFYLPSSFIHSFVW